ncbi:hypothetical protein Z051_10325 [Rhodococcus rhodochrous KG-21]|uniref:Uncharacterized protein n=1 Tax=Rhodococcus rhodochrous KG-21 TaxID=1441923 RepID=A0A0M8PHC5_RHORH|nr:hypothetical protein Z051_10325 [Rhodococcus rhodochrous KG-21]
MGSKALLEGTTVFFGFGGVGFDEWTTRLRRSAAPTSRNPIYESSDHPSEAGTIVGSAIDYTATR